jgi:hypothetical protein
MVSKVKRSKKKIIRKTQSKLIKRVKKKSASTLNTITRHGYSLTKKSSYRLKALTKYTNKFGIRKTISQLSKLVSRYITDNRISKVLLTDIKNLQKWITKSITKSLKGGDNDAVKKSSPMLEKLMDLSKKLRNQTSSLVDRSMSTVTGAISSRRTQLEDAVSGQVKKMTNLSAKITRKSTNLNKKNTYTNNAKKNNNKKSNNANFTNEKCELCMKHCTANGTTKQKSTQKPKAKNNIVENSPTEKIAKMIIKNRSKSKSRKINNNIFK